ncbi:endonuclease/exonuclease/phosphatase family protein [Pseudonocardia endophytica]|uniref:Endonuclease/exonuclease/phosphatase (EEP) superfamily protein YafD n=1 Tax=Pseudonocardia endophytica TaxID=401976 RepID=A0A4R1I173_PSEEN|nr:endonuclease/exonuclease/phosphatase family protein [Pseudonocardia endophytica]TCK26980.1 endonuclease/exonuclease/phosphatase (EEP) superfamily protein YafD [Pseudonocardia endophytica]
MRRDRRSGRRWARAAFAAVLGAGAAVVVLPDRLRIDHDVPLVDAVPWRPHTSLAALGAAGLLAGRPATRPTGIAVGAVAVAGLASVAPRAVRRPRRDPETVALTIMTANVLKGSADAGALAAVVMRERPDLVVLPEAGADYRDKLMPLLGESGYRSWTSSLIDRRDARGVTLLAAPAAGDLHVRPGTGMRMRHVEASGGVLGLRPLYAVHTSAPMRRRFARAWCRELDLIRSWTSAPIAPIVVGDLNATLDHSRLRAALGGCRSAASGTGRGLVGTYPSSAPRACGIQIDHVLVPDGTVTSRFEIVDLPGTDHRAVLTTVHLPPA